MFSELPGNQLAWWKCFWIAGILAVAASSCFWVSRNQLNGDVANYLYYGDRLVEGAALYRDIGDVNPPLFSALQIPPALTARALHLSTTLCWYAAVWLVFGSILLLSAFAGGKVLLATWICPLLFLTSFQFGILDRLQLSQRDQLTGYAFLPLLLCCAARMTGNPPSTRLAIASAAVAGLGIALKPHFLLPWLLVISLALFWPEPRWPHWRRLAQMPEFWVVAAIHATYAAVILLFFPEFLATALPIAKYYSAHNSTLRVYLPLWPYVLALVAVCAFQFMRLRAGLARLTGGETSLIAASAVAAFGFLAEAIVQHKGLPYHLIPFFLFFWWAVAVAILQFLDFRNRYVQGAVLILGAAVTAFSLREGTRIDPPIYPPALRKIFESDTRSGPILFLAADPWCTFPVVYESGQRMAQRDPGLWLLPGLYRDQTKLPNGHWKPAEDARYHRIEEMPEAEIALLADLRHAMALKPKMIYVQIGEKQGLGHLKFDYLQYVSRDPAIANGLRDYDPMPDDVAGPNCEPRCFKLLVRRGNN